MNKVPADHEEFFKKLKKLLLAHRTHLAGNEDATISVEIGQNFYTLSQCTEYDPPAITLTITTGVFTV